MGKKRKLSVGEKLKKINKNSEGKRINKSGGQMRKEKSMMAALRRITGNQPESKLKPSKKQKKPIGPKKKKPNTGPSKKKSNLVGKKNKGPRLRNVTLDTLKQLGTQENPKKKETYPNIRAVKRTSAAGKAWEFIMFWNTENSLPTTFMNANEEEFDYEWQTMKTMSQYQRREAAKTTCNEVIFIILEHLRRYGLFQHFSGLSEKEQKELEEPLKRDDEGDTIDPEPTSIKGIIERETNIIEGIRGSSSTLLAIAEDIKSGTGSDYTFLQDIAGAISALFAVRTGDDIPKKYIYYNYAIEAVGGQAKMIDKILNFVRTFIYWYGQENGAERTKLLHYMLGYPKEGYSVEELKAANPNMRLTDIVDAYHEEQKILELEKTFVHKRNADEPEEKEEEIKRIIINPNGYPIVDKKQLEEHKLLGPYEPINLTSDIESAEPPWASNDAKLLEEAEAEPEESLDNKHVAPKSPVPNPPPAPITPPPPLFPESPTVPQINITPINWNQKLLLKLNKGMLQNDIKEEEFKLPEEVLPSAEIKVAEKKKKNKKEVKPLYLYKETGVADKKKSKEERGLTHFVKIIACGQNNQDPEAGAAAIDRLEIIKQVLGCTHNELQGHGKTIPKIKLPAKENELNFAVQTFNHDYPNQPTLKEIRTNPRGGAR